MLRGAAALSLVLDGARLRSPLDGVNDQAWARFVDALTIDDDKGLNHGKPRPFNARTHSGGLGCFGISPRRLVDLGVARAVRVIDGKTVAIGVNPAFRNPLTQRDVLAESIRRFAVEIGKITLPTEMSRSGALALYHRLGPEALTKWQRHKQEATIALFRRANGLF